MHGGNTVQRANELKLIREYAIECVSKSKNLTVKYLMPILSAKFGIKLNGISYGTVSSWIIVGRKNSYQQLQKCEVKDSKPNKLTFDEVVSLFSSQEELAMFILEGFLFISKERNELMKEKKEGSKSYQEELQEKTERIEVLTSECQDLHEKLKIVIGERDRCIKLHNETIALNNKQFNNNKPSYKPRTIDEALKIIKNEEQNDKQSYYRNAVKEMLK
jgi:hypothetical protein